MRARRVALHQRLPHRAGLRAAQANQALVQLLQPGQLGRYLGFAGVSRVRARQKFGQIEVATLVLHQQHHARGGQGVSAHALKNDFGPHEGLDTLGAASAVKLDRGKQVVEVGNGQRALGVGGGGLHHLVHAVGAVNDGKFGVQAQVDKHGRDCRFGRTGCGPR